MEQSHPEVQLGMPRMNHCRFEDGEEMRCALNAHDWLWWPLVKKRPGKRKKRAPGTRPAETPAPAPAATRPSQSAPLSAGKPPTATTIPTPAPAACDGDGSSSSKRARVSQNSKVREASPRDQSVGAPALRGEGQGPCQRNPKCVKPDRHPARCLPPKLKVRCS